MVEDGTVLVVIFIITTNLLDRLLQKVLLISKSSARTWNTCATIIEQPISLCTLIYVVFQKRKIVEHPEKNRSQEDETRSIHTDDKFGKDRIKVQHLQVSTAALG